MKKLLLFLMLLPLQAWATTYYIDFTSGNDSNLGISKEEPWKYAPGMAGFTGSYSHSAGDQFILKGGVTWDSTVFNWVISNSGSSGNIDYYGVDDTWYTGASWTQPILDGEGTTASDGANHIQIYGDYVTLDNIKVIDLGVPYVYNGARTLTLSSVSNVTIQNCTFASEARIGILVGQTEATTHSNITLNGNDISKVSWGIGVATSANNAILDEVTISNNAIHDFTTQMCGGAHGDGIIIYRTTIFTGNNVQDVHIFNNSFYGDFSVPYTQETCITDQGPGTACNSTYPCGMNALVYQERGGAATVLNIYNNEARYFNVTGYNGSVTDSLAYLNLQGDSGAAATFNVYNNSFYGDRTNLRAFQFLNTSGTTTFKNNIMVGGDFPLLSDSTSCGQWTADNNIYYGGGSTVAAFPAACGGFQNWTTYHTTNNNEPNSFNQDPLFQSTSNLRLQAASPAIGNAVVLNETFTTDIVGATRGAAWDIGAYEYPSSNCDIDEDLDTDADDISFLIDIIQGRESSTKGDLNGDSVKNILDVMILVGVVNGNDCP